MLAPAIDLSADYGRLAVLPSLVGFLLGAGFVYLSDVFLPHNTVEILTPKDGAYNLHAFDETSCSSLSELPNGESKVVPDPEGVNTSARKRIVTSKTETGLHP